MADRRAQIAEARGEAMQSGQQSSRRSGRCTTPRPPARRDVGPTRAREYAGRAAGPGHRQPDHALATEQQRRQEADARAAKAAADLAAFASVKQDPHGDGHHPLGGRALRDQQEDLLPGAQIKLNEVADALTKQDTESKIVVEGYTDSQGGAGYNQELSQRRAQSVRDYLVSRGIAADRVTAQGFGLSRPIGDNASAEGRANNRRVEIVVQPRS